MNTAMADCASKRLDAQIADALFGQPGMSKMEVANRLRELRGEGSPLLLDAGNPVWSSSVGQRDALTVTPSFYDTAAGLQARVQTLNRIRGILITVSRGTECSMPDLLLALWKVPAELLIDAQGRNQAIHLSHKILKRLVDLCDRLCEQALRVNAPVLSLATIGQHFDAHFENCQRLTHILELDSTRHIGILQGGRSRHPRVNHIFLKGIAGLDDGASYLGNAVMEKKQFVDELCKPCLGVSTRKPPFCIGHLSLCAIWKEHGKERDYCRDPPADCRDCRPIEPATVPGPKTRNHDFCGDHLTISLWVRRHCAMEATNG